MCLFASGCLFHDCLTGCLSVVTLVSVCDRVEITTKYEYCRLYSTVKFPRVWRPEARVFPTDEVSKQRTRCVLLRLCGLFAATDRKMQRRQRPRAPGLPLKMLSARLNNAMNNDPDPNAFYGANKCIDGSQDYKLQECTKLWSRQLAVGPS